MKNLFLSGGGIKGISYIGFMARCYKQNYNFSEYHGVSIGSVFCLLILLKIPVTSIFKDIEQLKLKPSIDNLLLGISLFKENPIIPILKKYIDPNTTFLDLYHSTGKKLYVYTTNFQTKEQHIFNAEDTPDIKVLDAIEASCCLPLIFPIIKINNTEFIDGVFNTYTFPENCMSIDFEIESNLSKNSLMTLIKKTLKLSIPLKPKSSHVIKIQDTHSLNFNVLKSKNLIVQFIKQGYNLQ